MLGLYVIKHPGHIPVLNLGKPLMVTPKRALVGVAGDVHDGSDRGVMLEQRGDERVPKPVGRNTAQALGAGRRLGLEASGRAPGEVFEGLVHLPWLEGGAGLTMAGALRHFGHR